MYAIKYVYVYAHTHTYVLNIFRARVCVDILEQYSHIILINGCSKNYNICVIKGQTTCSRKWVLTKVRENILNFEGCCYDKSWNKPSYLLFNYARMPITFSGIDSD